MKKIYLLITATLLLLGSNSYAAVKVAEYSYEVGGSEVFGDVYDNTNLVPIMQSALEAENVTKSLEFYVENGKSLLTIPQLSEEFLSSDKATPIKVAPSTWEGENITITNNYGAVKDGVWKGGIYVNTMSRFNSTTINNNGIFYFDSGLQNNGISIVNSGTVIFNGGTGFFRYKPTITGDGDIVIVSGKFKKTQFTRDEIESWMLPDCSIMETSSNYEVSQNVVAKVGDTEYFSVWEAFMNSSEATPAVLLVDATIKFNQIPGLGSLVTNDFVLNLNGHNLTATGSVSFSNHDHYPTSLSFINSEDEGGVINASNPSVVDKEGISTLFSLTSASDYYAKLTIGAGVTINCASDIDYGVALMPNSNAADAASVNIAGNLSMESGTALYIHGLVKKIGEYTPEFNIADGASITSSCSNACIYAAGYGIWNIGAATLNAGTPIYAKSGTININGATIAACGEYAVPTPDGNGFHGTGDAIVLDSKSGYAGNMQLNVTDATISSANGYSVQEVLTDSPESSTIAMQITGGKYKGARGTIVTSKHFGESTPTHWAMNAIEGGKYAYAPSTLADGYKVVFNTDADKNEYPYTIVVDDLAPTSTIVIDENTIVDEVVNVAENTGIVVKSGVTYTVKGLVIGTGEESKSKVTVEPGAKLIVGSNGILNYANNQLVLQADKDNGCAILRFEGTTGIAQPYGKVELYMYAHKEDGLNVWQHIGIPTAEAPVEIAKTAPYMFNIWDLNKGWQYAPQSEVKDPWTGYNSSTNMESAGSKLTFVGQLVGNAAAEYVLAPNNYSCIANSYTDYVGIKGFINQLPASKTDGTVWVYGLSNNGKAGFTLYNESSFDLKPDPGFSPMQAFFIKNVTEDEIQLNIPYGEMGTTKDADASEVNGGVIVLTGGGERAELQIIEKEGLSDGIIDPKYDSEQFDTDMIKIYTEKCGKNLAAIGTNSLEGKEITIVTKAATSYTLSFEYLAGKAFKLTDLASGAEVEVGADKTYTFTAEANSTIKRFKLGEGEVAANEADADGAVSIWTNNGQVFVANNAAEADIEIINLSGVKVASAKASGEAVQAVSISNLASGVYVVRVGNTAAKIVK